MKTKGNAENPLNPGKSGKDPPMWRSEKEKMIAEWLEKLHFRRALFGVSERDVWKKLDELNGMYQQLLLAERIRYDTLLEQRASSPSNTDEEVEC